MTKQKGKGLNLSGFKESLLDMNKIYKSEYAYIW